MCAGQFLNFLHSVTDENGVVFSDISHLRTIRLSLHRYARTNRRLLITRSQSLIPIIAAVSSSLSIVICLSGATRFLAITNEDLFPDYYCRWIHVTPCRSSCQLPVWSNIRGFLCSIKGSSHSNFCCQKDCIRILLRMGLAFRWGHKSLRTAQYLVSASISQQKLTHWLPGRCLRCF